MAAVLPVPLLIWLFCDVEFNGIGAENIAEPESAPDAETRGAGDAPHAVHHRLV